MSAAGTVSREKGDKSHRIWPRRPLYIWGTVRALGQEGAKLLVRNMSKGGMMGETEARFAAGSFVEITLPGMEAKNARIAWCEDGRIGARFLQH